MPTEPAAFDKIRVDHRVRNDCSPNMDNSFGLQIAAPRKVGLDPRVNVVGINYSLPVLPACGTIRLPAKELERFFAYSSDHPK